MIIQNFCVDCQDPGVCVGMNGCFIKTFVKVALGEANGNLSELNTNFSPLRQEVIMERPITEAGWCDRNGIDIVN